MCSSKLMVDIDSMGPEVQLIGARFSNFLLQKLSREFKLREYRYFTLFKWPYFATAWCNSHIILNSGSPIRTVYVDVTLTRSKVKVVVTGLFNFRQVAKPCMLAAMTAAPLRGFLVTGRMLFLTPNQPWQSSTCSNSKIGKVVKSSKLEYRVLPFAVCISL